ncbi:MAG: 16S rRNA (cytidine(1402)-2'-O)-methyltransferase [Alphaproteobacteria bacterium RIFCSPLOWO2_01_FULL_40_26]|nr:MAG: 16S rRNA (cytidine(1402)-2'-O)-methyltransferase [Alphaproteobacteria bacterium RIFCSPHIGHO2_02_FULL_40_34]OFW87716.1 MAG: 16S rRNA (cytidine(1402)-2'-O)-methyltransferase [Alphaproteobacteria bacterium RIFCSPHIGHO2_01_FULL_40_8]OFW95512.1 MAG: 16S rRNA (cytidine(1402)-2'-O)-methyltransferase [Alphaproteobacteria bacterium RIFCSPLOWO2_01_FULL_40_26]OFX10869.1 MAG: 16S rRNA (cytidine(1402)-2'-O)-methyltransferase [Alphaproteobacteria bacterium RIFCSPLOWO2_12_FULL_40_11]
MKLENALYVVATPIGNLSDITLRALQILNKADFVICEDTRISMRLLKAYEIKDKKLLTYNDHSDEKMRDKIFHFLSQGHSLALITDAGTPLISDPGFKLINFLRARNQKIIPIPGASSLTTALCAAGIACDNFLFLGFLPTSKIQKEKLLKSLPKNFTFVFFESANRVIETLELLEKNRRVCVARELTKIHEEIISDKIENLLHFFEKQQDKLRGEFVIIVEKVDKNEKDFSDENLKTEIRNAISRGESIKDLSQNLSEIYVVNKKTIYQLALQLAL